MKRSAPLFAFLGVVIFLAGCGGTSTQVLHIVSEKARKLTTVDLGAKGKSEGDMYVFDGDLLNADRTQTIGHVYGTQTDVALEPNAEVVQAEITYVFGGEDSITIGGVGRYPLSSDTGLIKSKTFERPIIGGTGKYADARGTVTSVRNDDGTYDQTFHLEG